MIWPDAHFTFLYYRLTSQSEVEFNKASYNNDNNANRFLDNKMKGSTVKADLDQTVELPSHSDISWQLLVNFFNLSKEDLELR